MNRFVSERGYALITALIVLAITAALVMGFITQVNTQQKIGLNDVDYASAFYAAEAGLEKLNSDLSKQFYLSVNPTASQLAEIQDSAHLPSLPGATYTTYSVTGGQQARLTALLTNSATTATVDSTTGWASSGYFMVDAEYITYTGTTGTTFTGLTRGANSTTAAQHATNARVSRSQVVTIAQGPNAGLNAQVIPFTMEVVAQAGAGTEAKLSREAQVALVPVFQFGVFSDSDISYFAGPNFNFSGRVHTNGHAFLAQFSSGTLTLDKKVTAVGEIIRAELSNGYSTSTINGAVSVAQSPGVYRALARTEGSRVAGPTSAVTTGPPSWNTLSLTTYNGNILNGATGAKALTLPFTGPGVSPVEIIKRPPAGEDPVSIISESRLYNQASLRVLLSDTAANLPAGTGYPLNSTLMGYTVDASHPPFAAADPADPDYVTGANQDETTGAALVDGYIKIQMQTNNNTWNDVTMEILDLGFSGGNDIAATPNPNAILRFQRLKPAKSSGSTTATDYMPMSLYDAREARFRDTSSAGLRKIGIIGLVELDVNNLKNWFAGTIGTTGNQALNNSGYILYFSDRRGNRDGSGNETGEFGFEDVANPADATNGVPNNIFEAGEDFNSNGSLQTYGGNLPVSPYTAYPTNTDLYTTPVDGLATQLNGAMASAVSPANGGTITVDSTAGWTAPGFLVVQNEAITFTGMTGTTFTGITRGAYASVAAAHADNTAVTAGQSTTLSVGFDDQLNGAITAASPADGGTITVDSTADWPTSTGYFVVDSETITFTGKTATTFTGIDRGAYGTTDAAHTDNRPVYGDRILSATNPTTGQTIGMTATAGWPDSGYLLVGSEFITYNAKTAGSVTVQTRGAFGSTAAAQGTGSAVKNTNKAQKNRVWYFRRALRLINGASPNLPVPGFTVAAENPVYIQGNYNSAGNFTDPHSYAAVIADAVTLLSNSWRDQISFDYSYALASRGATTTWYRTAIASGKGPGFAKPTGAAWDVGTDGGVLNFLRYIEDWTGDTLNYLGSLVSLYYSRQGTGIYKCCDIVYDPPTRAYSFDIEFLVPSQLPPGTPRFRDINNLSFRQSILSNN